MDPRVKPAGDDRGRRRSSKQEARLPIHIIRLGSPRGKGEGVRLGTVRRPPRGVPKQRYAQENWYDMWLPELSPTPELMARAKASATDAQWRAFVRAFRSQMSTPPASHVLDLLSALSAQTNFSLGCYCEHEERCHRSVLRALLAERGAEIL
jgi:uncharacterized protein YeaO (DUF488 family)